MKVPFAVNPRGIHDSLKEAVVDSVLGNLSARLAGRGEFYHIILGSRPSSVLNAEFLVPMPEDERIGDEEASPIEISAHGLDFQISRTGAAETIAVSLRGSAYVRILPAAEDLRPGGPLEPKFPLRGEVRLALRNQIREGLANLRAELGMETPWAPHPDWASKSEEVRRLAHRQLSIPFDNTLDRLNIDADADEEEHKGEEDSETPPSAEARVEGELRDESVDQIDPPAKWLRIDLELPVFEFSAATAAHDSRIASDELNNSIARQLVSWVASDDEHWGGRRWGFRDQKIKPSNVRNWKGFLEMVRQSGSPIVVPNIQLRWAIDVNPDPLDPSQLTIHVALENLSPVPKRHKRKIVEASFFQVSMQLKLPRLIHRTLTLDRIRPSYRYNEFLQYPALGFNAGVVDEGDNVQCILTTNWAPRYVLPRIDPIDRTVDGICTDIAKLAEPDCVAGLEAIIDAYETWLRSAEQTPVDQGIRGADADAQRRREAERLAQDIGAWRTEKEAIRVGVAILRRSSRVWSGPGIQKDPGGIPFEAWLSMNAAFSQVARRKGYREWRLFQLAFILASIPTFATRIPAFHDLYSAEVAEQANAVTLLYFATGGGKSEAFLGLLVFVLFLDRLRGKHHGVSALMRYPLRLLTLQQARRTFMSMAAAEQVRFTRGIPGEPFSLGFWVGGSNTPNWHSEEGYSAIPTIGKQSLDSENAYEQSTPAYKNLKERWLKLDRCPFCHSDIGLALRRVSPSKNNTLGHFCCAPQDACAWNRRSDRPVPLPFYIVDEDIYDLAPSVLLGTVDKLSAIGQSQGTIRKFFGMFGFSPFIEVSTDRLFIPAAAKDFHGEPGAMLRGLFPTFATGEQRFFDPFPALLIQDEAHLLDESLGTFAGLFESALEAALDDLGPAFGNQLCQEPCSDRRRRIKVIAASATVIEPHRQMHNIYQRPTTIQFPHPGPHLYRSFYAAPRSPDGTTADTERAQMPVHDIERRSHWGRVYVSVLTNGHKHTVAMAAILGHYHLIITKLYEQLRTGTPASTASARADLLQWLSPGPLQLLFSRVLSQANGAELLTVVDLLRIALTYVTNKKGGDQVIDTERVQFARLHEGAAYSEQTLSSELISGAVSASEIQRVVRRAESRVRPGQPFPHLNETLRSIIATSAVSHGVDVEEFNAMFFAGMPSDIAEYIQASSRVGRTHVGFSLLVPVPQRYRDRFIFEIHDIFHRFLERMILPAAIDRWAEKALVRVMPSFFQEFVCGVNAILSLIAAQDDKKAACKDMAQTADVCTMMLDMAQFQLTEQFMQRALGLELPTPPEGADHYRAVLHKQLEEYVKGMQRELFATSRLRNFLQSLNPTLRPMTSLRDVDEPGTIFESRLDLAERRAPPGATARAMRFIRKGSGADLDDTNPQLEARGGDGNV